MQHYLLSVQLSELHEVLWWCVVRGRWSENVGLMLIDTVVKFHSYQVYMSLLFRNIGNSSQHVSIISHKSKHSLARQALSLPCEETHLRGKGKGTEDGSETKVCKQSSFSISWPRRIVLTFQNLSFIPDSGLQICYSFSP